MPATTPAPAVPTAVRCIAETNASRAGSTTAAAARPASASPDARAEARTSIVATLEAVRQVQNGGDDGAARTAAAIVEPAREAFVSAMHVTAVFTSLATLVAAGVVLLWLPGRRGDVSPLTD